MEKTDSAQQIETVRQVFSEYLKQHGLRKTPERFAILETAYTMQHHFTVEQLLVEVIETRNFHVSRATVYNTVELLTESKLLSRHLIGGGAQYEKVYNTDSHYHLICTNCGAVSEFHDAKLYQTLTSLKTRRFMAQSYSLYVYGLCGKCVSAMRKKQKSKGKITTIKR